MPSTAGEHPRQHARVLAEARPQEAAVLVLAEPVDVEDLRQLRAGRAPDLQPVGEVVGHVVAAERKHREGVEAELADGPRRGRRLLGAHHGSRKTPCCQSSASVTNGTTVERRPPKSIASIGTPAGSSHSGAIAGVWSARTVNRAFGCAAGFSDAGVQSSPCQSIRWVGGSFVSPSHQISPSSVFAQLVKTVSWLTMRTASGLVFSPVPGSTLKN